MKKSMSIPLLALATVFLVACNTVRGVGEDVQAGGEAIEDTARGTQEELSQ
nr:MULTISPECIES: entericidin A/B family lipoprotein [Hyphomonas]